jgi:putative PIN family toxin of toxin-antitoxin system
MKVVIDTNVFVSSFFGGNPRKIIDLWRDEKITLCLSKDILDEYIDVLQRVGLRDEDEIEELLSLFAKGFNILFTAKTPKVKAVKSDPDDDKFIECAMALKAEIIITGDKAFRAMGEYVGIKILNPQEFLKCYLSLQETGINTRIISSRLLALKKLGFLKNQITKRNSLRCSGEISVNLVRMKKRS